MKTIKEKNERAKGLVDYVDNPSLVRDLMHALDGELDWRMKSLVYYHLIRRLMDDGTFAPEQKIEMENVQRPFDARTWYLPSAVAFPVYDAGIHTFTDCFKGGETSFVVNLCAFVEENPVIGFRYACKEIYGDTILVKGLVPHHDDALQSMYPSWEFYRADRSLTDDMTAIFGKEFCHVFRAEVAHLDPEDDKLHRIFMTNG